MADNAPKKPEDIEKELSVGNFAGQQAITLGLTIGGLVVGVAAALGAARLGLANGIKNSKWLSNAVQENPELLAKAKGMVTPTIAAVGAFVGLFTGSTASMYGHWRKVEGEHLAVKEINKDVANLMEKRVQFEETLDKQSQIVQKILKEHEAKAGASQADQQLARRDTPGDIART